MLKTTVFVQCFLFVCSTCLGQEDSRQEQVINSIQSFVHAFNTRDAQAVANHWAVDGQRLNADGEMIVGRENIQASIQSFFDEIDPEAKLSVEVKRISFVTDDVAIEEGVGEFAGEKTSYSVVHKREGDQWKIFNVRETLIPPAPSNYENLKELEWMIGSWVDESDEAIAETQCVWSKNKNFITKTFKISVPGINPLEGTQVIGFDASRNRIRSWTFDSDGGFAEGFWTRKDNKWEVKSSQVLPDGRVASSTNILELVDNNQFTWKSIGREVEGEYLPNVDAVTVHRLMEEDEQAEEND